MEMSAKIADSKMENTSFKNLEEVLKIMINMIQQNKSYPNYILSLVDKNINKDYYSEINKNFEEEKEDNYDDEYDDEYDDQFDEDERCKCGEYYYKCMCKDIKEMYDKELDDYYDNNCFYSKYDDGY
jgi:hypothetical protein